MTAGGTLLGLYLNTCTWRWKETSGNLPVIDMLRALVVLHSSLEHQDLRCCSIWGWAPKPVLKDKAQQQCPGQAGRAWALRVGNTLWLHRLEMRRRDAHRIGRRGSVKPEPRHAGAAPGPSSVLAPDSSKGQTSLCALTCQKGS